MGLSRIGSLTQISSQLRSRIMSAGTEAELISLGKSIRLGNGDNTQLIKLLNSRMSEIRSANTSVSQLRQQISSATSLHEMNQLLEGKHFSPEEASSLQSVITRKRAELLSGTQRLSHAAIPHLPEVRAKMSTIFMRNLTENEANEIALRYKNILAEPDNMKFTEKLVNQMIVDYGFRLEEIPAVYADMRKGYGASFSSQTGLKINRNKLSELSGLAARKELFSSVAHELKHAQQAKIACQTDIMAYLKARTENAIMKGGPKKWQQYVDNYGGNPQEALLQAQLQIGNDILPGFRQAANSIPQGSAMYRKGLSYIEGERTHKSIEQLSPKYAKYGYDALNEEEIAALLHEYRYGNILESEAYDVEDIVKEIFSLVS